MKNMRGVDARYQIDVNPASPLSKLAHLHPGVVGDMVLAGDRIMQAKSEKTKRVYSPRPYLGEDGDPVSVSVRLRVSPELTSTVSRELLQRGKNAAFRNLMTLSCLNMFIEFYGDSAFESMVATGIANREQYTKNAAKRSRKSAATSQGSSSQKTGGPFVQPGEHEDLAEALEGRGGMKPNDESRWDSLADRASSMEDKSGNPDEKSTSQGGPDGDNSDESDHTHTKTSATAESAPQGASEGSPSGGSTGEPSSGDSGDGEASSGHEDSEDQAGEGDEGDSGGSEPKTQHNRNYLSGILNI